MAYKLSLLKLSRFETKLWKIRQDKTKAIVRNYVESSLKLQIFAKMTHFNGI